MNAPLRPKFRLSTGALLISLSVATLGTLIITPRPTAPWTVPLPNGRANAVNAWFEREAALLADRGLGLDHETRTIGEEFRRANWARARKLEARTLLLDLQVDASRMVQAGKTEHLLHLRALQTQLFLEAIHAYPSGNAKRELAELGADFVRVLDHSWREPSGRLLLQDSEFALLFAAHFGEVTGLSSTPGLALGQDEKLAYYSILLSYPEGALFADEASRAATRLGYVAALSRMDPGYPAAYARGSLLLQMGKPDSALLELEAHLGSAQRDSYALSARNQFLYASHLTAELE